VNNDVMRLKFFKLRYNQKMRNIYIIPKWCSWCNWRESDNEWHCCWYSGSMLDWKSFKGRVCRYGILWKKLFI